MPKKKKIEPTPRQKEYIALLASGASTLDVADICVVSQHTVRNTIVSAKERVEASSTYNLVAMSVAEGWIRQNNKGEVPHAYSPWL